MIASMRALLGDDNWAPDEVIEIIEQNNGYPSDKNPFLESLAPVKAINDGKFFASDGGLTIECSSGIFHLLDDDRLIVSTKLPAIDRGHAQCVRVCELFPWVQSQMVTHVIVLDPDRA